MDLSLSLGLTGWQLRFPFLGESCDRFPGGWTLPLALTVIVAAHSYSTAVESVFGFSRITVYQSSFTTSAFYIIQQNRPISSICNSK